MIYGFSDGCVKSKSSKLGNLSMSRPPGAAAALADIFGELGYAPGVPRLNSSKRGFGALMLRRSELSLAAMPFWR